MGDVNGLVNKALGIPDHAARLAVGWAGRVAIVIPSAMPVRVLAFPVPGGYAVSHNSLNAVPKGERHCAHRRGPWAMGSRLDRAP
jgi:hypothetical protein